MPNPDLPYNAISEEDSLKLMYRLLIKTRLTLKLRKVGISDTVIDRVLSTKYFINNTKTILDLDKVTKAHTGLILREAKLLENGLGGSNNTSHFST